MRARIFIAVAAWLLGAATATGGCLLAVSLLGDGFGVTGNSGQQLTAAGVNKALAAAERKSASAATPSRSARARPVTRRQRAARPSATPTPPPATPTPPPAQSTTPVGTPLSSEGGTVVAICEPAGAYLLSWSPAQGYEVDRVVRGPAAQASVRFDSFMRQVTMNITCPSGTPVSNTSSGSDH